MNWKKAVFLHIGWTELYLGDEAPVGGHAALQDSIGVEAKNFLDVDGEYLGYAPVIESNRRESGESVPDGDRTLNISKLGAEKDHETISGISVLWTARNPDGNKVVVGVYKNATAYRVMQRTPSGRYFIVRAAAKDSKCVLVAKRVFEVPQVRKGFPGQASAWYPGEHQNGPAQEFLAAAASYFARLTG